MKVSRDFNYIKKYKEESQEENMPKYEQCFPSGDGPDFSGVSVPSSQRAGTLEMHRRASLLFTAREDPHTESWGVSQ